MITRTEKNCRYGKDRNGTKQVGKKQRMEIS
jgi:hypothetical protein